MYNKQSVSQIRMLTSIVCDYTFLGCVTLPLVAILVPIPLLYYHDKRQKKFYQMLQKCISSNSEELRFFGSNQNVVVISHRFSNRNVFQMIPSNFFCPPCLPQYRVMGWGEKIKRVESKSNEKKAW